MFLKPGDVMFTQNPVTSDMEQRVAIISDYKADNNYGTLIEAVRGVPGRLDSLRVWVDEKGIYTKENGQRIDWTQFRLSLFPDSEVKDERWTSEFARDYLNYKRTNQECVTNCPSCKQYNDSLWRSPDDHDRAEHHLRLMEIRSLAASYASRLDVFAKLRKDYKRLILSDGYCYIDTGVVNTVIRPNLCGADTAIKSLKQALSTDANFETNFYGAQFVAYLFAIATIIHNATRAAGNFTSINNPLDVHVHTTWSAQLYSYMKASSLWTIVTAKPSVSMPAQPDNGIQRHIAAPVKYPSPPPQRGCCTIS